MFSYIGRYKTITYIGQYKPTSLKSFQYYIYRSIYADNNIFCRNLVTNFKICKKSPFLNIYTSTYNQVCQSKFSKIFLSFKHVMYELENGVVNIQNWIRNLKIIIPFFKVFRAEEVIQVKHILYNLFKITACIIKFWRRHLRHLDFISYIIDDRFCRKRPRMTQSNVELILANGNILALNTVVRLDVELGNQRKY